MASPNDSYVCFICLKPFSLHEGKSLSSGRSTLYKQFTSFVRSYLQITTVGNLSDGQVSSWENHGTSAVGIEAFCEGCSETVSNICELYKELCSVELRLSTKLEEFGVTIKEIKKPTLASHRDDLATSSLLKSLAVQLSLPTEAVFYLRNSILSKLIHKSIKSKDSVNLNVANYAQEEIEPNANQIIKEEVESLPDNDDDGENQNQFGSEDDCSESSDNRDDEENSNESDSEDNDTHETEQVGDSDSGPAVNVDSDNSEDEDDYEENQTSSDIESDESSFKMDTDEDDDEDITFSPKPKRRRNLSPKTTSQPKRNAESHVSIKKMFACEANECRQYFDSITKLNAHLKTHSTTIHSCCECNRGFLNPDLLTLHKLLHSKRVNRTYPCPSRSCSTKLPTAKQLQSHYNIKHGLGLGCFKCPKCELNLASEPALIAHLHKHDEAEDPSLPISEALHCIAAPPCSVCGLQFLRLQNLDEHRKEIHKLGVECPTCKKLYSNRTAMRIHRINHHKLDAVEIVCEACGKSYKNKSYLREHMVNMHPDLVSREALHQCSHCLRRFHRKHHLVNHLSKCPKKNPNPVKIVVARRKPSQQIVTPCHVCGKLVKGGSNDLKMHLRSHQPKPITSSSCSVCKEIVERPFLRKHMETHKKKRKPKVKNEAGDQDMDDDEDEQNSKSQRKAEILAYLDKMFACDAPECRTYYKDIVELNSHLETHSSTIYSCSECERGFLHPEILELHKLLHTEKVDAKYPCPSSSCSTKFDTPKELQSHFNIKHGIGLGCFKCPKCDLNLATEKSFIKHLIKTKHDEAKDLNLPIMEAPHRIATPPCSVCGLQFMSVKYLDLHRKDVHKLGVECPTCNTFYSDRMSLNQHIHRQHKLDVGQIIRRKRKKTSPALDIDNNTNSSSTQCEVCGKLVKGSSEQMQRHLNRSHSAKTLPCKICGLLVEGSNRLQHMESHQNPKQKELKEPFICDICGEKFTYIKTLNYHLNRRHGIRKGADEKMVQCHICGNSYSSEANLALHQVTHNDEKQFPCYLCPYKAHFSASLKSHLVVMHGKVKGQEFAHDDGGPTGRKRNCRYPSCKQVFFDESELKSHVEQEHQAPNDEISSPTFMCNLCGRIFVNQQRLTRHNEVHSQEKRYKCPICQKGMSQPNVVKEHLSTIHGVGREDEYFSCTQPNCNTRVKSMAYLHRHLRKVHGVYKANQRKRLGDRRRLQEDEGDSVNLR
ncbi:unnamed protein product [Orchesella dallaii]|uniref:C2H2-type domain-containing protein n=1 Tax=Orchesella dallaii TaxID=48710 RepID=A0ABP1RHJ7_9HEXA